MCTEPREQEPEEYQMYPPKIIKVIGELFFGCWWLFMAYMIITSRKDGLASYVMAYGFFAFATGMVIHTICNAMGSKLVVTDGTVTRYFPVIPPKTYDISEITRVAVHRGRSGIRSYRVYIGKKRAFELDDTMVNLSLFLTTLQEQKVPFTSSIL